MNLIVAFAQSLKHRLRFEPYVHYSDMRDLVQHLDTFAKHATELELERDDPGPSSLWESWGGYLGLSFATPNPRRIIKQARYPLGNLPLEILNHLNAYIHDLTDAQSFRARGYESQAC